MYSRSSYCICLYLLVFAFVADFPSDAPEFYQHMRRIPDKKSSHEIKYRKVPKVR